LPVPSKNLPLICAVQIFKGRKEGAGWRQGKERLTIIKWNHGLNPKAIEKLRTLFFLRVRKTPVICLKQTEVIS
jgi:hypothetical protein